MIGALPCAVTSASRWSSRATHGLEDGSPFPTTYWLTCPWLVKEVSTLESEGWLSHLNERLAAEPSLRERLDAATRDYIGRRDELEVIEDSGAPPGGGSDRVKCAHAHVAHELVSDVNPIGALTLARHRSSKLHRALLLHRSQRRRGRPRRRGAPMRVAVIDVGTNSTRLLVAEDRAQGFRSIERRMEITRLGQGVDRTGMLADEALTRTLSAIADYAATCGELGVSSIRVTGTSAVRDASNRALFFDGVKKLTGSEPEMLSGDAEGRATFRGAVSELHGGPFLVVDIGGGSTEFTYGSEAAEKTISLNIGCVRMFEKHLHEDPPDPAELAALRAEVKAELTRARDHLQVPSSFRMVGVAGTVTQLACF